jgi:hypothetical protein
MLADKRYAAACHEAAHAVICLRLNQTFKCIRLREEAREKPKHLVGTGTMVSLGQFIPTEEPVDWNDAFTEAQIDLAGLAFEKVLRPHHSYAFLCLFGGPANDYQNAMKMCRWGMYNNKDSKQVELYMFKHLLPHVRKQVIESWNNIVVVGDLLAKRGELTQVEVVTTIVER